MTTFVNLTPHVVHIQPEGKPGFSVAPHGILARCTERTVKVGDADGVPLVIKEYGEVTDLPEPQEGVLYIVSMLVRLARPERNDIASPGDLIRDTDGKIVGCKNLTVNP